ncbi:hypothetical protein [Subtercola sp. RTI3]|uniref:hypothetical protein n=1 Tax=Subtercola sp. RTI3 TaxID=3048639 RepID=UPI002B22AE97|nr:hypothetical protein [Subtercola sp. RTI3]MEA9983672.1 hypothetical protein [Subtercola sp. RTI3]
MSDIEVTRQILSEREEWNAIKWEAFCARVKAGMFVDDLAAREWLGSLPKDLPSRGDQAAWAIREARVSGVDLSRSPIQPKPAGKPRRRPATPFFTPRQMEIASAALDVVEARRSDAA